MRKLFLLLLLLAAGTISATVAVDPNNARGFGDKVFQLGDIDSVNVFNGNLTVQIPMGTRYSSGPSLAYQLVLTNNSKVWDYQFVEHSNYGGDPKPYKRRAIPERESNAGLGWMLSLGRLLKPRLETYTTPGHGWIYLAPDGSQHEFYGSVTKDNSYLRLKLNVSTSPVVVHQVEFPDGTIQKFEFPDSGETAQNGRLTEIRDRFDNWVKVVYSFEGFNLKWTITDGHGASTSSRSNTVRFSSKTSKYNQYNFYQVVRSIELAAFDGETATYTFAYEDDEGSLPSTIARGGCGDWISSDSSDVAAPLLQSVTLPDGSMFLIDYNRQDTGTCSSGALKELVLPTHGAIKWEYGEYVMPQQECTLENFWITSYGGVTKRSFFQPGYTTAESVWTYSPNLTSRAGVTTTNCSGTNLSNIPLPPEEFTNTIVSPAGDKSVHFFSVYPPGAVPGNSQKFDGGEYGLPFTRHDELQSGGRALSSELYDCTAANCSDGGTLQQKTYVEYEHDGVLDVGRYANNRLARQRVRYEQDSGCSGQKCHQDTDNSEYDGFGHYRKTVTSSNYPDSVSHTTFTNFNPGSSSTGLDSFGSPYFGETEPWILGTYDYSWVKEGTKAAKTEFEFDPDTGVMTSVRTLKAGLPDPTTANPDPDPADIPAGNNDLLTAYCRDGSTAGVRGFVTSHRRVGGDVTPIPSGETCSASWSSGHYFVNHAYSFTGSLLTGHTAGHFGSSFYTVDETFDAMTGLVKATRDTSDSFTTDYVYDTSGRITEVRPPEQAWTRYVYDRSSSPAWIRVELWPLFATPTTSPSTDALKDDHYYFDGFGRLILSKTRMPSTTNAQVWAATRTKYDAAGRVEYVSTPVSRSTSSYETITPTRKTSYTYDVHNRPSEVVAPDATKTQTNYHGGTRRRTLSFVESDNTTRTRSSEEYDGRNRLVRVTEPSGTTSSTTPVGTDVTTTYTYDFADRLVRVDIAGPVTQTREFTYDNRGWLTREKHPEKGTLGGGEVTYLDYDAAGHAGQRTEGTGAPAITTKYEYDGAERLTKVLNAAGQTVKSFDFATANGTGDFRNGKLWQAKRYNRLNAGTIVVTETYIYGGRGGRVNQRDTKIEHEGGTTINTFSQTYAYDAEFGLPQTIGYPTCNATGCSTSSGLTSVTQTYDKGFVETVTNFATIDYHPTGMVSTVTRAVPTTSQDIYTSSFDMARPASIRFLGLTACAAPSQPQVQAPASVCPSSTGNSASIVGPIAGVTYNWSITGGTITSPASGATVTFSAGSSGSVVLTVTAANSCGSTSPVSRSVPINGPTASVSGSTSIDRGQSVPLTVTLSGTSPWQITWEDGYVQSNVTTSPATRSVSPTVTTTYRLSVITSGGCTGSVSGEATITVYPPSPASVTATSNNSAVAVTWTQATGANSYQVERSTSRTGSFVIVGTTAYTSINDTVPASATPVTYVYRVRTIDSAGTLSQAIDAPLDFATTATTVFAEVFGSATQINSTHIAELQRAVDSLRLATSSALPPLFGGAPSLSSQRIAAADFTSLINALNAARTYWGLSPFTYAGYPPPASNGPVYGAHVTQLREAVK